MISVDATPSSAVVTCTLCPSYVRGALDRPSALRLGAEHEATAHPGEGQRAAELVARITTRRVASA